MIYIQIDSSLEFENHSINSYDSILLRAAKQTLAHSDQIEECDATIVVTNDEEIRDLNKQYLEQDQPTDVLAFPSGDSDPDTQILYLGDVVISYPRAKEQAAQAGHHIHEEMQLLVVHGMLHLLGYDHTNAQEKAIMWNLQSRILTELGCSPKNPS